MAFDSQKIVAAMKKAIGHVSDFCVYTAQAAEASTRGLHKTCASAVRKAASSVKHGAETAFAFTKETAAKFFRNVSHPFVKMAEAPRTAVSVLREKGFGAAISYLYCGVRNNKNFFSTIVNYAAPVLGVFILCSVISSASHVNYALEVTSDGQHVGYIEDESVLTSAQESLRQRIIHTDGTQASFELNPELSIVAVSEERISNSDKMTDSLIRMSNEDISEAEGLYIDGEFYGAVTDAAPVETILKNALDQYRTGQEGEQISFVKDIEIRKGLYLNSSVVPSEKIEELLLSSEQAERTYTIEKGDSPIQIASKNGLSYADFKAMNPTIEEVCMIGQKALIATEKPFLSVRVVREETTVESIDYETEIEKDNSQYIGYSKVLQEGQEGSRQITASVEYTDGYESSREVLSTEVLEEPVTKKIVQGTKQQNTYSSGRVLQGSTGSGTYSGDFIWPVSTGGYISCGYSSWHRAIDIPCAHGTAILASKAGTVIRAGWDNSYGKVVIIDHGNGVQTLYAHNSALNVSVGDYVEQGQTISQAGNTGYSFGTHCHFEVRINGQRLNPLNYVG